MSGGANRQGHGANPEDWLQPQGFNEKQALHLKWLSKDMNEHERYMADFMTVFQILERWGPKLIG